MESQKNKATCMCCDAIMPLNESPYCDPCLDLMAEHYDDSMDGDHDSAMESIGWGTDEDYGFYGDDE